jgi:hypothetical protein
MGFLQNEQKFLAKKMGVDEATQKSEALKHRQIMRGKRPVQEETVHNYNVPYFSKFLRPPAPHFTRGGMHAAAYQSEQARLKAGLKDNDGVHFVDKASGEKLAKELEDTEQKYLLSENKGIIWQSPEEERKFEAASAHTSEEELQERKDMASKHLDKAQDQTLARELEAGIAYATLPNHGVPEKEVKKATPSKETVMVTREAGKKLARELEDGEREALAFEAADTLRHEKMKEMEAAGDKPTAKQPYPKNWPHFDRVEKGKTPAHKLVKKEQKRPARIMAARQRKLQQLYHMPATKYPALDLPLRHQFLTPAQDRNVATYLLSGINKVFPDPKPVVHHFLSKDAGEQLVAAAKADEAAEKNVHEKPAPKYVGEKAGMHMAMEMEHDLAAENKAGGRYVDKYLNRVTGRPLRGASPKRYVMQGSNEGEKWYNAQLSSGLENAPVFASELGWEKKEHARNMQRRKQHQKYLNPRQIRELGEYMQPALHLNKGQAPGLGYAV